MLPLLIKSFDCHQFIGFGSAIDVFIDRCFGHHFDPSDERDRHLIDRIHEADEQGLKDGKLTPTHMIGLLSLGKSDFEAIGVFRDDRFFKESLGLSKVPGSVWIRQRLDAKSSGELREHLTTALGKNHEVSSNSWSGKV